MSSRPPSPLRDIAYRWSCWIGARPAGDGRDRSEKVTSTSWCTLRVLGNWARSRANWCCPLVASTLQMRPALRGRHFDQLIAFPPISAVAEQVLWLMRQFSTRNYLAMWDFFPYHHCSIGPIADAWLFAIARRLEQSLIRRFDVISCMSRRNCLDAIWLICKTNCGDLIHRRDRFAALR